jgi:hypothetical protein
MCTDITAAELTAVLHPFERGGLGKAPFRFIGVQEKTYQSCPGAPVQPGGTCDYCSNGIRYVYRIRSADGKVFGVGSECVRKLDRADNRLVKTVEAAERALKRKQSQAKRAAALPKELARVQAAFAAYASDPAIAESFAKLPHPRLSVLRDGTVPTKADYVSWLILNAGHTGRFAIAKEIEKEIAKLATK